VRSKEHRIMAPSSPMHTQDGRAPRPEQRAASTRTDGGGGMLIGAVPAPRAGAHCGRALTLAPAPPALQARGARSRYSRGCRVRQLALLETPAAASPSTSREAAALLCEGPPGRSAPGRLRPRVPSCCACEGVALVSTLAAGTTSCCGTRVPQPQSCAPAVRQQTQKGSRVS